MALPVRMKKRGRSHTPFTIHPALAARIMRVNQSTVLGNSQYCTVSRRSAPSSRIENRMSRRAPSASPAINAVLWVLCKDAGLPIASSSFGSGENWHTWGVCQSLNIHLFVFFVKFP